MFPGFLLKKHTYTHACQINIYDPDCFKGVHREQVDSPRDYAIEIQVTGASDVCFTLRRYLNHSCVYIIYTREIQTDRSLVIEGCDEYELL